MKKRSHREAQPAVSLIHVMMADAVKPMSTNAYASQMAQMWLALAAIERAPQPTRNDWRLCSDAVNIMESLVDMEVVADEQGLLKDAVQALAEAGQRTIATGAVIRLTGPGMAAVRAVLEDYAQVLEQLPARTMMQAQRNTEKRILAMQRGLVKRHDVQLVAL